MEEKQDLFGKCPYFTIQKILSGKWAFMILYHLQEKTLRFNQIQKLLPEVTQTTLTKQLMILQVQELEDIEKLSLNLLNLFSKQRRSYDRVQFKQFS